MGLLTMFTSCESLDQAPEDFFASGNFWKDQPQVSGYMTGLHRYLRSSYGIHFTMGELRGGLLGDGDDGSGVSVFGESMYGEVCHWSQTWPSPKEKYLRPLCPGRVPARQR